MENPGYPNIRIHCPCAEPVTDGGSENEDEGAGSKLELPPSLASPYALHALNSLYFCDNCMVLRCERCIVEEVVQTYCPSCLQVYSADTTASGNDAARDLRKRGNEKTLHCTRNCLQCPLCFSITVVLSTSSEGDVYLQCPHCFWDSRNVAGGLTFTKYGTLYNQLQTFILTDPNSENSRFSTLSSFYKDVYDAIDQEESEITAHTAPNGTKRPGRSLETSRFIRSYAARRQASSPTPTPKITPSTVLGVLGRAGGVSSRRVREEAEKTRERYIVDLDESAEWAAVDRIRGINALTDSMYFFLL
ncbi:dynactin p62 family-domain-containing protein [Lipomyces arxii]|uniref:dynactin p62 family-domain-containing protein n=1 Tax=Lipomyces arxii TaxID=56418 RepID=UPI0034CEF3EB